MTEEQKIFIRAITNRISPLEREYKETAIELFPEAFEQPKQEGINVRIEWDKDNNPFHGDWGVRDIEDAVKGMYPTQALYTNLSVKELDGAIKNDDKGIEQPYYPEPTEEMLNDKLFNAIWEVIREWDIGVAKWYSGYTGALVNHARAIYDKVKEIEAWSDEDMKEFSEYCMNTIFNSKCDTSDKLLMFAERFIGKEKK